jgi:thiol-disulfide isomerase/thioredoxin
MVFSGAVALLCAVTSLGETATEAAVQSRVHLEVRAMMKAREGRVLFTDLWNGDALGAAEKEYAARLYEVFFVLPGHVQRELGATGAPPTRAAIAANFGLSIEGVDLLLAVMTGEPRMPKLFRLDPATREIVDVKGQPALVWVWLTRCPVCRRVTPSMVELDRRLGPKGLRIAGLNSDGVLGLNVPETERDAWIREQGIRYPNAALDPKTRAAFAQNIFPAFFLVGRDGRVRKLVLNERSLDELEQLARPLLEEPAAASR